MIIKRSKLVPLLLIISLLASSFAGINVDRALAAEPDEFDQMREKWFDKLTGGDNLDPEDPDIQANIEALVEEATDYWTSMDTDPDAERLWDDLDIPESAHNYPFNMQASYTRLKQMALAYAIQGSELYHDESLLDDIIMGMEWVYTEKYNENTRQIGNWWQWQIGLPLLLNDLVVLLYDELTENQKTNYMNTIDHFVPDPTRRGSGSLEETGANRVDKALAVALRGVIGKNPDKIAEGRDALNKVFLYSTGGDGFYKDGSFIQHGDVAYTGSYGYVLIDHLVDALYLLGDSPWEVTDPNSENVYQWVKDSYEPLVYKGLMMDMVRGRAVSRESWQDHIVGRDIAAIFLRLAQIAPAEEAHYIKSVVKSWIEDNDRLNYEGLTFGDVTALKTLLNDSSIEPKPELELHKQYSAMDRVIHRRPGFAFGISMSSERIRNYETGNDENLRAWYTGQGMTYLYNGDLAQFNDNFWPNVDHYRLPGTTSDGQTRQGVRTGKAWAGGAAMDDLYGVAGMELDPDLKTTGGQASKLSGKKSWFMFDDEIVALGAGITSESGTKVETIVENRKINVDGDNTLIVNGEEKPSDLTWSETMTGVDWVHLEGNTDHAHIGYYFPDGRDVTGKRESNTQAWSYINTLPEFATYTPSTRNFLSLAIEHGTNPVDDRYSYVLLPNKTVEETEQYYKNPDIEILSNTSRVQAVKETQLGLTAVNFFSEGPDDVAFIRSYNPASVIVKEEGDELTVSVSDPTQVQDKITLELGKVGLSILSQDDTVTVSRMTPYTKIEIDVSASGGQSHTVKLKVDPQEGELPSEILPTEIILDQSELRLNTRRLGADLTATVLPADAWVKDVIWSSSDPSVATVDSEGYVTAISEGEAVITVESVAVPELRATSTVIVEDLDGLYHPTDDAFVRGGQYAHTNFGSEPVLTVKSDSPDYTRKSYLKFDLTDMENDDIQSAVLRVYAQNVNTDPSRTISAYATDSDWSEAAITWNNAPEGTAYLTSKNVTKAGEWYEFDVTDYIKSDGRGNIVSFLLTNEGEATQKNDVSFTSKEGETNKPQLLITKNDITAARIKTLVERFEKEGEFASDDVARLLKRHLTAVSLYEEKELAEKVAKHMDGFKLLLDHQKENALISEKAYYMLKELSDGRDPGTTNIAAHKPGVASSVEVSDFATDFAFDGDESTRWSSARTDNEWIYVDLQQTYLLSKVILKWEAAYGKEYKIQVSDDAQNWKDVYTTNEGNGGVEVITFPTETARYVRMLGMKRATSYGYSLYEFEVYQPSLYEE